MPQVELAPSAHVVLGFQEFEARARAVEPDFEVGDVIVFDIEIDGEPVFVTIDNFSLFGTGPDFHRLRRTFLRDNTSDKHTYLAKQEKTSKIPRGSERVEPDFDATAELAETLADLLRQVDQDGIQLQVLKTTN